MEKIACSWQFPSWALFSWEVPAHTCQSSNRTVKPLAEALDTRAGPAALPSRHHAVAAGALRQACSDQSRDASRLLGKLVDEQRASL